MSDPVSPPRLHALAEAIGRMDALDEPADTLAKAVRDAVPPGAVKDALSGTWLGHALHPLLTDVVIGPWVSALVLDVIGGRDAEGGADVLIGTGLLAVLPTATSGLSDWADTTPASDQVKRIGFVHLLANDAAIGLFGASLLARRRGNRGRGKAFALLGALGLGFGGLLGGHLSYAKGVGVDMTAHDTLPEDWTAAASSAEVIEGQPTSVDVEGTPIFLLRRGGQIHALHDTCAHRGGSLSEGELVDGCIECPLHGSRFRLEDGAVERGPSTVPQPSFDVRETNGVVEVKHRF